MSKESINVLPENLSAQGSATQVSNIPNLSTQQVVKNAPVENWNNEQAYGAQAALTQSHLDMAGMHPQVGSHAITQIRQDLAPIAEQLKRFNIPDVRLEIDNIPVNIPFDAKQFAIDLDQPTYLQILFALLGEERLDLIRKHSTKSNQAHTPALWLNQLVIIEMHAPYVYTINRALEANKTDEIEELISLDDVTTAKAAGHLRTILGGSVMVKLGQIADINRLSTYVIFVLLVDKILARLDVSFKPASAQGMWEFPKGVKI